MVESGIGLGKNFRISNMIANQFWKRWVREVLPCLTRRTKWHDADTKPINIDDVVLIVDEKAKWNTLAKGIVVDVHKAKDGVVRSAVVKTADGMFIRPMVKLAK